MSGIIEVDLDKLMEYDECDAEIFYSYPIEKKYNYLIQYKITVADNEITLDLVKSKDDDKDDELLDYDDCSILVQNILKLPIKEGKKEIKNIINNWESYDNNIYKDNENAKNILQQVYSTII